MNFYLISRFRTVLSIKFILIYLLNSYNSYAIEDVMLRDANKCLRYFPHFERSNDIPQDLLKAISIIETRRWHNESSNYIPWPWAVNSHGKAYYFTSKQEAISEVRKMLASGQKSIDVGCMQINLHHHPKAFKTLEEAFEPSHNISYAANFLKNNFKKHNNWKQAIAAYHSENHEKGHPYAYKVIGEWHGKNIRLANARINNKNHPYVKTITKFDKFTDINQRRRRSELLIKVNNNKDSSLTKSETLNMVNSLNKGKNIRNLTFID